MEGIGVERKTGEMGVMMMRIENRKKKGKKQP